MASDNSKEVLIEFPQRIKVYKDGKVERLLGSPYVPPSLDDPISLVSSKDITISPNISARLYLPKNIDHHQKLPILVYFHAGAFCVESAFSFLHHRYLNLLVSEAKAVAVSVEYGLAPEHPLPAGYEDSWAALQWVASHNLENSNFDEKEPWLVEHGDFGKFYMGGDSAGGNIVHHMGIRAGVECLVGGVKILGGFISHPYFWSSKYEKENDEERSMEYKLWMFVYPSAPGGIDDPSINPLAADAPDLSGIECSKLFVCTAEKDEMRDISLLYVEALKKSCWKGELEFVEVEGEDHSFHLKNPDTEKAKSLISRLASFIKN